MLGSFSVQARPRAEPSVKSNATTRVIGALDARTGRVAARQRTRLDVPALVRSYRALVEAYPDRRLYVVLDNRPVHFHPDVLAALEPQASPSRSPPALVALTPGPSHCTVSVGHTVAADPVREATGAGH
jgi:hypothetical protein